MNRIAVAAVVTALSLAACKNEAAPAAAPGAPRAAEAAAAAPKAPGGTQVADFPVSVDLPAGAVANDPLGAPGFHSEDGSVSVMIAKVSPDSPTTIDATRKGIEEFLFKKWVKSEARKDGWLLTWVGTGIDMSGNEYENFPFEVVKKVGDQSWRCSGSVKSAAQVEANVKLCESLKAFAD